MLPRRDSSCYRLLSSSGTVITKVMNGGCSMCSIYPGMRVFHPSWDSADFAGHSRMLTEEERGGYGWDLIPLHFPLLSSSFLFFPVRIPASRSRCSRPGCAQAVRAVFARASCFGAAAEGEGQAPIVPGSGRATRHICPHIVLALPKRRRTSLLNRQQLNAAKGHVLAAQGPWPIRLLTRHGEGGRG